MEWGYLAGPCSAFAKHPDKHKQTHGDGTAHLIGGVLAVGLALGGSAGHGPSSDVTEIDLTLRGGAASRLAPDNDGAARQDLGGGGGETERLFIPQAQTPSSTHCAVHEQIADNDTCKVMTNKRH